MLLHHIQHFVSSLYSLEQKPAQPMHQKGRVTGDCWFKILSKHIQIPCNILEELHFCWNEFILVMIKQVSMALAVWSLALALCLAVGNYLHNTFQD